MACKEPAEGLSDGLIEGLRDGLNDGLRLGDSEGESDGESEVDGLTLGDMEGERDGLGLENTIVSLIFKKESPVAASAALNVSVASPAVIVPTFVA